MLILKFAEIGTAFLFQCKIKSTPQFEVLKIKNFILLTTPPYFAKDCNKRRVLQLNFRAYLLQ